VMHIQDADAVGSAIVKLHNALDKEMAAWRKRTAVNKKITHRSVSKTTFLLYPAAIGDITAA